MFQAFWSSWVWPLITAVVGFIFTGLLLVQYAKRRKPHQLAWAVGFLLYAVPAVMESYAALAGHWNGTVYRFYYVMAAALVAFLGLGTLYLVFRKRIWGNLFLGYIIVVLVLFLYKALTADLITAKLAMPGITIGGLGMPGSVRMFSPMFTGPGTLALLGGSIYSIIKFLPNKAYRYRVWANVLIIIGTMFITVAGFLARAGMTLGLYPGEMLGATVLLLGFLMAGTLDRGAKASVAETRRRRVEEEAPSQSEDPAANDEPIVHASYEQEPIFDIDTAGKSSDDTLF